MTNPALNTILWPPPYTIRRSLRAQKVFLQIIPKQGLEIVIPHKRVHLNVATLLDEKRHWIEKMLLRAQDRLANPHGFDTEQPSSIACKALEETWSISYQPIANTKKITLIAHTYPEKTILLKGNTYNITLCHCILIKWLKKYAELTLMPWLKNLSETIGLTYHQVIIRGQSTLWGSCNSKRTISLNYKLLFLPRHLVQYVLFHELCHLKYLNHSKRFWQLLRTMDSDCMANRKALKAADHYLPPWLDRV